MVLVGGGRQTGAQFGAAREPRFVSGTRTPAGSGARAAELPSTAGPARGGRTCGAGLTGVRCSRFSHCLSPRGAEEPAGAHGAARSGDPCPL